ncbi:aminotransferase class V-fold PLP-dependent enzyme [Breznakiella homolactica]|uniref:Aminotransferase class V-fold PLP-dependent enzyme n=1 Tax=Breznakiella homolactica TaxID=2798577 RepID=A0A7T7XR22_9SPIR|nr:aminotransferase class V-fold PLP-dependent enzyme [Breznakiella homolactica]QQO10916.1 aminotransferase class V-fold PLP-dependent enzyme [Breznakiella homolactica]
MKTFPLPALSVREAAGLQFSLVDAITRHFPGAVFFSGGDLGLVPGLGRPAATKRTEETLADFFGQEDAVLVRGAGTGAIRSALGAAFSSGGKIFIHDAPPYPTTGLTFEQMNLTAVPGDFNTSAGDLYERSDADGALVQLARQKPDDSYDYEEIIRLFKTAHPDKPVITDDNYAVMKVPKIGCQAGADLSCFSLFKLLGPEGIGCVTGKKSYVEKIRATHYSGGVQVQGPEALEALRSLVYAPVALALQAEVCGEVAERLKSGEIPGIKDAFVVNAQSRVVVAELEKKDARKVLECAERFGAAPYPVGSESRYEIAPLFYRVSGTFLRSDPGLATRMIRINPMRAGAGTVMDILRRSIEEA